MGKFEKICIDINDAISVVKDSLGPKNENLEQYENFLTSYFLDVCRGAYKSCDGYDGNIKIEITHLMIFFLKYSLFKRPAFLKSLDQDSIHLVLAKSQEMLEETRPLLSQILMNKKLHEEKIIFCLESIGEKEKISKMHKTALLEGDKYPFQLTEIDDFRIDDLESVIKITNMQNKLADLKNDLHMCLSGIRMNFYFTTRVVVEEQSDYKADEEKYIKNIVENLILLVNKIMLNQLSLYELFVEKSTINRQRLDEHFFDHTKNIIKAINNLSEEIMLNIFSQEDIYKAYVRGKQTN
ncbi:hypothetical protein AB837_00536 [bacterium AB1]|nr:hypothetical protein AB837_00536 [bacterium AB1]